MDVFYSTKIGILFPISNYMCRKFLRFHLLMYISKSVIAVCQCECADAAVTSLLY